MKYAGLKELARVAFTAFTIFAAGCSLLSPVQLESRREVLNQMPHAIPQRATHAVTLLVLPPETNPIFNTTQMAYQSRPYQIDFFARHEWSATPAQMLEPLLIKTMEETHYFSEVLTPPYPGNYTFALRTWIAGLSQDYTAEPATAHLSLRVQLIDGATGKVIASRVIEQHEPIQQNTPYSGVVAANDATARALQELAMFMLDEMNIVCSSYE